MRFHTHTEAWWRRGNIKMCMHMCSCGCSSRVLRPASQDASRARLGSERASAARAFAQVPWQLPLSALPRLSLCSTLAAPSLGSPRSRLSLCFICHGSSILGSRLGYLSAIYLISACPVLRRVFVSLVRRERIVKGHVVAVLGRGLAGRALQAGRGGWGGFRDRSRGGFRGGPRFRSGGAVRGSGQR